MNFVGFFKGERDPNAEASHLRVTVVKEQIRVVDVALPANSARWLIDLIPTDVIDKIKAEGIPIEDIQAEIASRKVLNQEHIFTLTEPHRTVEVWLE